MPKFLIKLTPIGPYFFGDENAFRFGEKIESYYIKSLPVPPMTSVIGMLRYVLLEESGVIKVDGNYDKSSREKMNELIGENGYSVELENSMGKIADLSPLFIVDENGGKYIQTPLNHKTSENIYTPLAMRAETIKTSHGDIKLPIMEEFNAKDTVGISYMNIRTKKIEKELFLEEERVGINKKKTDEAFFKKMYYNLKSGYSFAFVADIDFALKDTICYMGREKSAFKLTALPVEEKYDVINEIQNNFDYSFSYAMSDLILKEKIKYSDYAMVQTGSVRMLKTEYDAGKLKIRRHETRYNVIKAGSVFMKCPDKDNFYKDAFGLNKIIELGGSKE